jgi:hypothetical protein
VDLAEDRRNGRAVSDVLLATGPCLSGMLFFAVLEGQGEKLHIEPLLFALDSIKEHLWQN